MRDKYDQKIKFEYFPVGLTVLSDHDLLVECGAVAQRRFQARDQTQASDYDRYAWSTGGWFDQYRYHIANANLYASKGHQLHPKWHL